MMMRETFLYAAALAVLATAGAHARGDCAGAVRDSDLASERFADGVALFRPVETGAYRGGVEIELVHYRADEDCQPVLVDQYAIEGGDPRLEAHFIHPIKGEPNLFAIVSWPMDHAGLGMSGRMYSVFAYRQSEGVLETNDFVMENREISGGVVGTVEGETSTFEGATQDGLISLMASQGEWSWRAACDPNGNQYELTACAYVEQIEADKALGAALETGRAAIEAAYAHDPDMRAEMAMRLDRAQAGWDRQLETDLDSLFPLEPGENPATMYGSSWPMRYAYARAYLVGQRADYLREVWLPAYGLLEDDPDR